MELGINTVSFSNKNVQNSSKVWRIMYNVRIIKRRSNLK